MNFIVTGDGTITSVINGKAYNVASSHPNYTKIKEALRAGDEGLFVELSDVKQAIQNYVVAPLTGGQTKEVTIVDNKVMYGGVQLNNVVSDSLLRLMSEGFPFEPLRKFLENLMENPSNRAINELYPFLEKLGLALTEDGCFLGYKTVRGDFKDKYSGKFDNTPGQVVEMPRNAVDDDCHRTCSHGFHVGALSYAGPGGHYNKPGDRVVIVKVNPRDCVSVPTDYSGTKLRVCKYEVLREYEGTLTSALYADDGDVYQQDTPEMLVPEDVWEGDCISFTYRHKTDEVKTRYLEVDEISNGYLGGYLLSPEEKEGEYRRFNMSNIIGQVCIS